MHFILIDSHPLFRTAISFLLKEIDPDCVIKEHDSLISLSANNKGDTYPSLICMDIKLIDSYGVSAIKDVKSLYPITPLIIVSSLPSADYELLATQLGADEYIEKTASAQMIKSCFNSLLNIQQTATAIAPLKLSRRQNELLPLLEQGMTNREVALKFGISEHTVKVHMWRLFKRLNAKNRSHASYLAKQLGLISKAK